MRKKEEFDVSSDIKVRAENSMKIWGNTKPYRTNTSTYIYTRGESDL
jgi:hypothetical protein